MDFASLPPDVQAEVQEKQRQKKAAKKQAKLTNQSEELDQQNVDELSVPEHPSRITMDEYFGAARGGLFRDPKLAPTEENLELLLNVLSTDDAQAKRLGTCNYFQFSGPAEALWDPIFNAKLAYEGFFTITTGRRKGQIEPLPELQPFYGVLTWPNFESSKHVRKALTKLRKAERNYRLVNCKDPDRTWRLLNAYHLKKYGSNWLTDQYFRMIRLASDNPSINFKMCCIELYGEDESHPLAGEIGFSIGRVYTSLSGWTEERTAEGLGFAQLVLLCRWLQRHDYAFWSLGHCYSPQMDYKRELGHRVYPRADFLALLKQYRGDFRCLKDASPLSNASIARPLDQGESCEAAPLLEPVS